MWPYLDKPLSVKLSKKISITCQENGMDDQLWQISMQAGPREKLESAKYFEAVEPHRAVILYQKVDHFHKALYLAFKLVYYFLLCKEYIQYIFFSNLNPCTSWKIDTI